MNKQLFTNFINTELAKRGMTRAELARRAGMSRASVTNILNHDNQPAAETCRRFAAALDLPVELVLRSAGYLPHDTQADPGMEELDHIYANLPAAEREIFLNIARSMLAAKQKRDEEKRKKKHRGAGLGSFVIPAD